MDNKIVVYVSAVRLKVVDSDYNVAVIYQCHGLSDDGRCRRGREQVSILCRQPRLDDITRRRLYELVMDRLCVDVYDFVETARGLIIISARTPSRRLAMDLLSPRKRGNMFSPALVCVCASVCVSVCDHDN